MTDAERKDCLICALAASFLGREHLESHAQYAAVFASYRYEDCHEVVTEWLKYNKEMPFPVELHADLRSLLRYRKQRKTEQ